MAGPDVLRLSKTPTVASPIPPGISWGYLHAMAGFIERFFLFILTKDQLEYYLSKWNGFLGKALSCPGGF